ncbi:MAG: biotin--[Clostridia bacterium]|nr:biotin--[acetyl-CoA-carboxylase] ligase [Clostridia bacterium]
MNRKNKWKILRFDRLPSTNDYAKSLRNEKINLAVIAKEQSGGRGTKGRSFSSEKGGLYVSFLTFYENFPAKNAFSIMASAATAVCKTLEKFGIYPKIKWPNDIYVSVKNSGEATDKKICGILIENTFSGAFVSNSVVGIGVNIHNRLPDELRSIATTAKEVLGKELDLLQVEKELFRVLEAPFSMDEYTSRLGYLGVPVKLLVGDKTLSAIPCDVTEQGELIATVDGKNQVFSSAEVSLRLD